MGIYNTKGTITNQKLGPRGERLGRICSKCGNRFIPKGKFTKICDRCNSSNHWRNKKQ